MIQAVIIRLLSGYQRMSEYWQPHCRYVPTCSEYAKQSLMKHGALVGIGYAILRLLRCHPFSPSGYDPV